MGIEQQQTATNRIAQQSIVFVPGGFHGGWSFQRVARLLRAAGADVYAPSLTGLGDRAHLVDRPVTLDTHIDDIANLLVYENLREVLLCGHSYGGMVITAVADRMPDRVATLCYLDAALPLAGRSTLDLMPADDAVMLRSIAFDSNGQKLVPPAPAQAYGVNEQDLELIDALSTPHPLASLDQPINLTGAWEQVRQKCFIRATGWAGVHPEESYRRAQRLPGWIHGTVGCSHEVMLDAPEWLAQTLLDLGAGTIPSGFAVTSASP